VTPTCLSIQTKDDSYYVVGILNTDDCEEQAHISLSSLGIEYSKPLVFEYYSHCFDKIDEINVTLAPFETKVYAVREDKGVPEIVSTSRHITQGIAEVENAVFENDTLSFTAALVENDPYSVVVYVPSGYKVKSYCGFDTLTNKGDLAFFKTISNESRKKDFKIEFSKG
jgi:hypothetical protein